MAVGIGRGISLALASQGADVVVADPDLEAARGTAVEVAALGVRSAASRVDIADVEHHGGYVSALEAEFGPIGILVNIGTAEEVAQAAVFLASEAASCIPGRRSASTATVHEVEEATMKNYLEWLAQDTPTKWWHDSAIPAEIDAAIANGALGVTTNPVLTLRSLLAVPEFWQPLVERIPGDLPPPLRAEELLGIVARHAASRLRDIYERTEGRHGYALGQLDPSICSDPVKMLGQAMRYVSWAPNIAVKLPTVKAALPVVEDLAARGIAVCTTLNFSVSQALAAGEAYERGAARARAADIAVRPCFVVQQGGRLDDYLRETAQDNGADVGEEDITNAGNAVCKKTYRLFRERSISATIMPAGLRGVHHLAVLAGADMVFSLQTRVQRLAIEADLPRVERIDEEIPPATVERLRRIPEFVRAYEEGALAPEDFVTFGVTQRTLSQFLWTGWAPLETYGVAGTSERWF